MAAAVSPAASGQRLGGGVAATGTGWSTSFRGVRVSKFRHVYGQSSRREQCYENVRTSTSAHDGQLCAVNPKFIAVAIEVAGGGAFQVLPLKWTGKVDYHFGRVSRHGGPVSDLSWNPFNDNVLASASDDGVVRLWHIADEGVRSLHLQPLCELSHGVRRVLYLQWHPAAENVLAAVGSDNRVLVWNVSVGEVLTEIQHSDVVQSLSWEGTGNMLATTCRDHMLRVFDARNAALVAEVLCHEGMKSSKACFLGKTGFILTTGFDRSSRRQIALWPLNNLRPVVALEIDSSPGPLFPFFDQDLNIVYVAGKGDGNIRYYELSNERPYLHFLNEFTSRFPQRGLAAMPKRGVNVAACEIMRFYKVHTTQALLEPISFIVPRKSDSFQSDIYPRTAAATASMTCEEWLAGCDRPQVTIALSDAGDDMKTTHKPVQVKPRLDAHGGGKAHVVITSDRNNERKFRFLSQAVRPDYRHVSERDDKGVIIKEQQLLDKLAHKLAATRQSSTDSTGAELESPSCEQPPTDFPHAPVANGNHGASAAMSHDNLVLPRGGKLLLSVVHEKNAPRSELAGRISVDSQHSAVHMDNCQNSSAPPSVRLSVAEEQRQSAGGVSSDKPQHSPVKIRRIANQPADVRRSNRWSSAEESDTLADTLARISCAAPIAKIDDEEDDIDNDADVDTAPSPDANHAAEQRRPSRSSSRTAASPHGRSLHDRMPSAERLPLSQRSSLSAGATATMRNRSASPRGHYAVAYRSSSGASHASVAATVSASAGGAGAQTKPGRIGPRMLPVPKQGAAGQPQSSAGSHNNVHQVKPFRIVPQPVQLDSGSNAVQSPSPPARPLAVAALSSKPPLPHAQLALGPAAAAVASPTSSNVSAISAGTEPSGRHAELERVYASQCRRVRELLSACDEKDKRLAHLERDLADMAAKLQQHEALVAREKGDKDSLRYEIEWKNRRIAFLEEQLHKVDPHGTLVASHADDGVDDSDSQPADTDSDRED